MAESAVNKLKHLVAKIVETEGRMDFNQLDRGLPEMRNTPNDSGISPTKMVFGQEMRSILPSIAAQLIRERRKNYYNQRRDNLDALAVNDKVCIQDDEKSVETTKRWNRTGIIISDQELTEAILKRNIEDGKQKTLLIKNIKSKQLGKRGAVKRKALRRISQLARYRQLSFEVLVLHHLLQ